MSLIPWPYRWLAAAALATALIGFGWVKGAGHVQAQWDAAVQQQTLQAAAVRERQAQATVKVVNEYVDRVRIVREKGDTIIKEVPIYVPVQADAACTINRGFVRLHDAAAAGELPKPARDADAAATGLALSAVAGTFSANYQTCHENAEQLRALQAWVAEAERRRDIIARLEAGGRFDSATVEAAAAEFGASKRQFNRYRKSLRNTGALTCLLPRGRSGGRGRLRLDLRVEEVITEVRLEFSRHRKEAKNHHAFAEIRNRCVRRGLIPPSHNTLRSRFAGVPARERVGLKYGKKVARERYEHIRGKTPETTFPLERIQIDHTLVDVVCASAFDREHVGRPWITIALDECTRAVLAFVLTWEYPNASTVAQCMTRVMTPKDEWLERVGVPLPWPMYGTPNSVYLDNAAEFWSRALFYGCREYGIAPPEHRPPGLVHFGGIIERFMGTAMDQMRLLPAATARDRGFDKVKTRNPNEAAEMTLDELEVWMLEFICGQYHVRPHSTTKQRPDLAWERGIYGTEKRAGAGLPPIIADKQKLYLDFADIEDRTIERYGMRWDNIEYWDEVLRPFLDAGEQRKFVVRRNPYDASRIYFLHPIEGTYCELRCEQITLPNVSVWEFNETRKRLVAQIGDKPDMATIMASMERQRLLEQDAQNAKKRHRSRLKQERRRVGEQVTAELTPHAPISEDAPPAPQAPVRRDIFYEIDE